MGIRRKMLSAEAPMTDARKSANGSEAAGVGRTGGFRAGAFAAGLAVDFFSAAGFGGAGAFTE